MINFFKKLFCSHKWNTHTKHTYEWTQQEVVSGTEHWFAPKLEEQTYTERVEILICEHCGKIKKLLY